MRHGCLVLVAMVLAMACLAGCGNVYLTGEAMTAAETSALDSYNACERGFNDPNLPLWTKAYLGENAGQWRSFVRSAKKDENWGPKVGSEVGK